MGFYRDENLFSGTKLKKMERNSQGKQLPDDAS
jgi:hypothetical protein